MNARWIDDGGYDAPEEVEDCGFGHARRPDEDGCEGCDEENAVYERSKDK
jgi:hypothetical protein